MDIPCKVSTAEMREALRLNLTAAFWWKAALGNFRALAYLVVLIVLIATKIKGDTTVQWQGILVLVGVLVLLFGLYLGRLHRAIIKRATQINDACSVLTVDGQGINAEMANGGRTFTPWPAIHRWREGKLVFTIGDAKTFRVVPKSALGEMQSAELRSLLLSQIR
jgi:hypothetical protein